MSSSPILGAPNPETQTWPVLTDAEIDRVRPYGRVRQAELGEILYRPGQVGASCYILLSATVQIVQPSIDGERLVTNHFPGTFTGEAVLITGTPTIDLSLGVPGAQLLGAPAPYLPHFFAPQCRLREILFLAIP